MKNYFKINTVKALITKEMCKFGYLKINKFCLSKDTIKNVKNQSTNWEKVFATHVTNKKLIAIISKEHLQIND